MNMFHELSIADLSRKLQPSHLSERGSRHFPLVDERNRLGDKSKGRSQDRPDLGRRFGEREVADIVDRDEYREGLAASRIVRWSCAVQRRRIDFGETAPRLDR